MHEQQGGARQPCELGHVRQNRAIRRRVFDRDQNVPVHLQGSGFYVPANVRYRSQTLSSAMITPTVHASTLTQPGFTNWPILCGLLVNITRGNTANGSCRLRTTWLRMISGPVPPSDRK